MITTGPQGLFSTCWLAAKLSRLFSPIFFLHLTIKHSVLVFRFVYVHASAHWTLVTTSSLSSLGGCVSYYSENGYNKLLKFTFDLYRLSQYMRSYQLFHFYWLSSQNHCGFNTTFISLPLFWAVHGVEWRWLCRDYISPSIRDSIIRACR